MSGIPGFVALANVPSFADGMIGEYKKIVDSAPIAVTFRHHADGRLLHAVYQVTAIHRGLPRVEVYGVMAPAGDAAALVRETHDTWMPAWALDEYWFDEAPHFSTAGAAREGHRR